MNPNSISHRLFAASLSSAGSAPAKRPVRESGKSSAKQNVPRVWSASNEASPKLSALSWSGWQQTTI